MPVFISYSHKDKDFVNRLAAHLVKAKTHVWVDTWELNVGDSLITTIQRAIQEASALLVVLSKSSAESEWCKKELSAGLIRELEEKRVVVLPVLLDDCIIPLFLRDKVFADFRTNYDEGLRRVLEAIAKVTSDTLGRIEEPKWNIDWGMDWFIIEHILHLRLIIVEQAEEQPYVCLSEVLIIANEILTSRYLKYERSGLGNIGRFIILEGLRSSKGFYDQQLVLTDNFPQTISFRTHDPRTGIGFEVKIVCRRLGEDTGKDVLLNIGKQVSGIIKNIRETLKPLTPEDKERFESEE